VSWYDDGGGCFDTANRCFWLKQIEVECPTAGDPPQPWSCYRYELLECQIENCTDADKDGYPVQSPTCQTGPFDCDDTDEFINPGIAQENCNTPGDDNCNNKINCEDEECRIALGEQCDEQCDQDNDGYYKASCDGDDCHDNWFLANPGIRYETTGTANPDFYCEDDWDNDCDGLLNCDDPDCDGVCIPPPPPTPTPTPGPFECDPTGYEQEWCENVECNEWDPWLCDCVTGPPGECGSPQAGPCCSPIVIDISGDGFDLTNAANGVLFDLNGDGVISSRLAWTSYNSDDAWLALDRNENGLIEKGAELFGNFTDQPPSTHRNGFEALALFDEPQNGGNGNGRLDAQDSVFVQLRLWQDVNHNGVSEMDELHSLPSRGVAAIDLDYRQSRRRDQHGNRFRYRARVRDVQGAYVGRWAWDVFLRSESLDYSRSVFLPERRLFSPVKQKCGT